MLLEFDADQRLWQQTVRDALLSALTFDAFIRHAERVQHRTLNAE